MNFNWRPDIRVCDANAGYGKTEILCTRLLATFLVDSDAAHHTVALTFTRSAAGEIYTRMLLMLCEALSSEAELVKMRLKFRSLLKTDAFDAVGRTELRDLLVLLVRDMGELNISTIDSFFFRLVRVYAVELGLPGAVDLIPEDSNSVENDRLTRELFGNPGAATDELLAACRESRFGNETKSCFDSCRELLRKMMKYRVNCGDPDFWGGPFLRFVPTPPAELRASLEICRNHDWIAGSDKKPEELLSLLESCARADSSEYRFTLAEQKLLRSFLGYWEVFPSEGPTGYKPAKINKDGSPRKGGWLYPPHVVFALRTLFGNGRNVLLCQCARRTAALRSMLEKYLDLYDARMLRRGRFGFADLPLLLDGVVARKESAEEFLDEVRYRTNSRFLHFLLDEFQDTSRLQWRVLAPIAADNGDDDHSLFIVGDVKQAIYGWREGDSKLMGEVRDELVRAAENSGAGDKDKIVDRLEDSFRYGDGICSALNHVFGTFADRLAAGGGASFAREGELFRPVWTRWQEIFTAHHASPKVKVPGELDVLALDPDNPEFEQASAVLILQKIEELGLFRNGLSGGVLVRSKSEGIKLRDALLSLAPELAGSIVWEGDESIVGDPLVATLLSFGVWLQHPSDALARGIVEMNQLTRDILPADREGRLRWKKLIAERGIHGFLRHALARLNARSISWDEEPAAGWDPVQNGSVDTLLGLAENFDASGESRDFLRFRALAAAAKKPAAPAAGKLRLQTIHHSKGLTFDVVFHPVADPTKGIGNWKHPDASGMVVGSDPAAGPWLIRNPREEGMTDKRIAAAARAQHSDSCFEELCDLYVALTRGKFATYVFIEPRIKAKCEVYHSDWTDKDDFKGRCSFAELDTAYYISDFLFESCFFDPVLFPESRPLPVESVTRDLPPGPDGEEQRIEVAFIRRHFGTPGIPPRDPAAPRPAPLAVEFSGGAPRVGRSVPSRLGQERKLYFTLPRADAGEQLGTSVHAFFAGIGRWSEFVPAPDTPAEISAHYAACKANAELVALLDEPCSELWLERPFDVVAKDDSGTPLLISGCFDRVQIRRNASGGVERAHIIDYKSNQTDEAGVSALVEHYRGQLESYRRALAVLLGITPNLIDCSLVFTRIGTLAKVE